MNHYRVRRLGRTIDDGFAVTRRDGDAWVWLPMRFNSFSAADRWITAREMEGERAFLRSRHLDSFKVK